MRVLIADPDPELASIFVEYFSPHGFDVVTTAAVEECIRLLREFRPDVVVLNPAIATESDCERLMALAGPTPVVPLVLVTNQQGHAVESLFESRVWEYYFGPLGPRQVASRLAALSR